MILQKIFIVEIFQIIKQFNIWNLNIFVQFFSTFEDPSNLI